MSDFETFLAHLPLALATFDSRLRVRSGNRQWRRYVSAWTGERPGTVLTGRTLFDLLPGTEPVLRPLVESALGGETIRRAALRLVSEETVIYWDVALAPADEDDGPGFILAATDVTERVLARTLLEQRVEDRTRKLSALYAMLEAAVDQSHLADVLDVALAQACSATRADGGMLQLYDAPQAIMRLIRQHGLDDSLAEHLREQPLTGSVAGWAAGQRQTLALGDVTADERTSVALRHSGYHAVACLPITIRGRSVAVLSVFRRKRRTFSGEDLALLESLADQLSAIVERALLRQDRDQLLLTHERNRLARELHDSVTQSLYSLTLFAETIRRLAPAGDPALLETYLQRLTDTSQQALREIRLMVHNLRPLALESMGLVRAIEQRLAAVERRAGIQATIASDDVGDLPAVVEETLYFMTQEALNNSLRHAAATQIRIELRNDGRQVLMRIGDNGIGFDPQAVSASGGIGLNGMRERAEAVQGDFRVDSVPGEGTTLTVTIDLLRARGNDDRRELLQTFERLVHE